LDTLGPRGQFMDAKIPICMNLGVEFLER
jgi:hypothetical protein